MASVGESDSTNKRKGDGQRELQKEASKSKKRSIAFIDRSHKEEEYAKCNSCRIDISVARGGKNDVTKHVTSENHKKAMQTKKEIQR